jgi:hypothetical protein
MFGNAHAPNKEPHRGGVLRLLNVESCAWELVLALVAMTDQTKAV